MREIFDISLPLSSEMVIWPGSPGFHIEKIRSIEKGNPVNNSKIVCDVHSGTHIDAPLHHIQSGDSVEKLSIQDMVGPSVVADLSSVSQITATDLERLNLPEDTQKLLLRTHNSEYWKKDSRRFRTDYVGLSKDAAEWLVKQNIRLVGIDYLSIQMYFDSSETHQILLNAGVIILEGLNLGQIKAGQYELICLPLNIVGAEGSPARVVLRKLNGGLF